MAQAAITRIGFIQNSDPNVTVTFDVLYVGSDVIGLDPATFSKNFMYAELTVTIAKSGLANMLSSLVAQVRSFASAQGFTVPANSVFAPSYTAM